MHDPKHGHGRHAAAASHPASPSTTSASNPVAPVTNAHLHAKVKATTIVEGEGRLLIHLEITAENRTGNDMELKDPYLVAVRQAQDVEAKAWISPTPKQAAPGTNIAEGRSDGDSVIVEFRGKPTLKSSEVLRMEVSFKAKGAFEVEDDILWGPYVITPMSAYQGSTITHNFNYKFIFKKPEAKKLEEYLKWPFKVNRVIQSNKLGETINYIVPEKNLSWNWKNTPVHFRNLDIQANKQLRIMFVRDYTFRNWLSLGGAWLAGYVTDKLVEDHKEIWHLLGETWHWMLPHLKSLLHYF